MLQMQGVTPHAAACAPHEGYHGAHKPVFYREALTSGSRAGQSFSISLAYDDRDRTSASEILNRLYGQRGYGSRHQVPVKSECMTFTACCGDQMIGTLTLRVDSSNRLSADETCPIEMAELRSRPRSSLCELTKFAFDPSPESRPLLAKLFHVIFVYGTLRFACSDLVIEVNPRHVVFYETMLGFARVGPLRTNELVHAPAQLMHLSVAEIGRNITRYAGAEGCSSRSLYPHFLGVAEERELRSRIVGGSMEAQLPPLRAHGEPAAVRRIHADHSLAQTNRVAA